MPEILCSRVEGEWFQRAVSLLQGPNGRSLAPAVIGPLEKLELVWWHQDRAFEEGLAAARH
ncbi:hypothetical protein [Streptomyces sp. NPDC058657]|uniref:hypothetical protein n=1 Tax=unclassified Streptomyces TaxID=2593676 RepID=UPI003668963C